MSALDTLTDEDLDRVQARIRIAVAHLRLTKDENPDHMHNELEFAIRQITAAQSILKKQA